MKIKREKLQRVGIVLPVTDLAHTAFMMSMLQAQNRTILDKPANLEGFFTLMENSSILPYSRQILAVRALEMGATHLFYVDSDMAFPSDAILRLLAHRKPIVGINAMSRRPPYRTTAQSSPGVNIPTGPDSTGLEKVHRMGFGMMLIEAEVFRSMEAPWFDVTYRPDLGCFTGEDYYFFEKAREQGYEFFCDHDLSKEVQHLGTTGFNPLLHHMGESQ